MRPVNDYVSQFPCGRYFLWWCGDELLLNATNDADAIVEGNKLQLELEEK